MNIIDAQQDIRRAFVGGGPGAFVSGLVWLTAALAQPSHGITTSFAILFFGGMLIFPLSTLACRVLFRRVKESPRNPLGRNALESTIAMIGGLVAAWLFLPFEPAYVFPLSAIAVGTHYAVFRTVYGDWLYWLLGALITLAGFAGIFDVGPAREILLYAVGAIEIMFGIILTMRARGVD